MNKIRHRHKQPSGWSASAEKFYKLNFDGSVLPFVKLLLALLAVIYMFGEVVVVAGSASFGNISVVVQAEFTTLKLGLIQAVRLKSDVAREGEFECSSM
ncbi:hypothetical protein RchiOBHm_Chr6g0291681 [Rosa chinensis]|uniref:Uncharacterized protein n=1 Tax=Rosa chinensis TaxID=74649 RepID=A0A2P6PW65_ROSCH|nr:hypothetical protein RchiOBHm_Chr6g0291681 [Rosa chinensis]